ncbi:MULTISPECIES: FkbM family methyltransferase [Halomonadaceae]|jgi:FkbM family methyltransferase|uniref:FkbM family methyltransferase n=1 Tax=Vreelandella piezotolerans TaxID=2609667 RepID=A0ABQ6XD34_9GAMM|nr:MULTISPECIES: FkbM family methyltransferase [Halomonas]KAE8439928.1 FkbM family methyltransferase [Halomonas piezotolerans]MCG7576652.1 FkbM family methyltransferase [Halomonas sp. MMH1-48]MCG7589413.1 FkbM family methyltransferase [Halomonas sp. McD50-5]MCG7603715.1 FkbM family methyltransferase [Halomonas sp. MM17-34]MCG7612813.1 FkbM family methyltransferase [Halomonas sp. MM17-29]
MPSTLQQLRSASGLARSLFIYWRPGRQRSLKRLYQPFLVPGDIAFDIGAHLGDRSAAFQALGAQVIALEPQPALAKWFQRLLKSPHITLLPLAVGPTPGHAEIAISVGNPTLSTLATEWRRHVGERNAGFQRVRWEETLQVEMTTLDALIERFGEPRFIKIDVEGFEAEVLQGLSCPVAALSMEFVAGMLDVTHACLAEVNRLGDYRFNAIAGEQRQFRFATWLTPEEMASWLAEGAEQLASGDIYACRSDHPLLTS